MPLISTITVEIFDVLGIDFIGTFPYCFGNEYVMLAVDYVSKWVEAIPTKTYYPKAVVRFLRENILARFWYASSY